MSSRDDATGGPERHPEPNLARRQPRAHDRQREAHQARERQSRERRQPGRTEGAAAFWGGYDILWGAVPDRPAARRSPLDRTRIVRAAIRIGDAEGLEAVTMRRIGRELRTGAMSLYRHVPDKGALISLMIDEVLGEEKIPAAPSGDWRADVWLIVDSMWAMMQRHPWYPEAAMERPPITPNGVAGLEFALGIFDGHELSVGDRMGIMSTLTATVTAVAINAAAEARTRARLQMTEDEMMSSAGAFIGRIIDSGKFPRFSELMSGMMNGADPPDPGYELRVAVELILDGIAARLAAAPTGTARPQPETSQPETSQPETG